MALDYYLTMRRRDNHIDPGEVRATLLSGFHLETNLLSEILSDEGVSVSVFSEQHDFAGQEEGVQPGVCVAFRIDKFEKHERGIDRMLHIVDHILRRFDGEASLTFEFEDILLSRTAGHLTFAEDPDLWTPARRAMFAPPH
jgi:hypothetical protein